MIRRAFLAAFFSLCGLVSSNACDILIKQKPTWADFPLEILVARVRVLEVQTLDGHYKQARLQRLETFRGDIPDNFGAIGDYVSDCGYTFLEGKELVIGLIRRKDAAPDSFYAYEANALTQLWVGMFYARR